MQDGRPTCLSKKENVGRVRTPLAVDRHLQVAAGSSYGEEVAIMAAKPLKAQSHQPKAGRPLRTLAIDIGASGIKLVTLNELAEPLGERIRIKTPEPATPNAVVASIL